MPALHGRGGVMRGVPVLRAAAIHDLSGFGRASLTVAIPVLATMGIQTCPLPTAVLSSQTSGIKGLSFLDLTVTTQAVYTEVLVLQFCSQSHTDCSGKSLSQRTGGHIHTRDMLFIGMSLQI